MAKLDFFGGLDNLVEGKTIKLMVTTSEKKDWIDVFSPVYTEQLTSLVKE